MNSSEMYKALRRVHFRNWVIFRRYIKNSLRLFPLILTHSKRYKKKRQYYFRKTQPFKGRLLSKFLPTHRRVGDKRWYFSEPKFSVNLLAGAAQNYSNFFLKLKIIYNFMNKKMKGEKPRKLILTAKGKFLLEKFDYVTYVRKRRYRRTSSKRNKLLMNSRRMFMCFRPLIQENAKEFLKKLIVLSKNFWFSKYYFVAGGRLFRRRWPLSYKQLHIKQSNRYYERESYAYEKAIQLCNKTIARIKKGNKKNYAKKFDLLEHKIRLMLDKFNQKEKKIYAQETKYSIIMYPWKHIVQTNRPPEKWSNIFDFFNRNKNQTKLAHSKKINAPKQRLTQEDRIQMQSNKNSNSFQTKYIKKHDNQFKHLKQNNDLPPTKTWNDLRNRNTSQIKQTNNINISPSNNIDPQHTQTKTNQINRGNLPNKDLTNFKPRYAQDNRKQFQQINKNNESIPKNLNDALKSGYSQENKNKIVARNWKDHRTANKDQIRETNKNKSPIKNWNNNFKPTFRQNQIKQTDSAKNFNNNFKPKYTQENQKQLEQQSKNYPSKKPFNNNIKPQQNSQKGAYNKTTDVQRQPDLTQRWVRQRNIIPGNNPINIVSNHNDKEKNK